MKQRACARSGTYTVFADVDFSSIRTTVSSSDSSAAERRIAVTASIPRSPVQSRVVASSFVLFGPHPFWPLCHPCSRSCGSGMLIKEDKEGSKRWAFDFLDWKISRHENRIFTPVPRTLHAASVTTKRSGHQSCLFNRGTRNRSCRSRSL